MAEQLTPKPIILLGIPQSTVDPMGHLDRIGKELSDYHVLGWRSPMRRPQVEVYNCPADESTIEALRARIEELCPQPAPKVTTKAIRK